MKYLCRPYSNKNNNSERLEIVWAKEIMINLIRFD